MLEKSHSEVFENLLDSPKRVGMGNHSSNQGTISKTNGDVDLSTEGVGRVFVEGRSAIMQSVEAVIRELAQSEVPVLLLAERGAGKHTTARRIHDLSRRSAAPFRVLHCSTLKPRDLDASIEDSHDEMGTIFLKELADLNAECQAYLQRTLSGTSGSESCRQMPRFIFGSACDLEVEVSARRLREDLYYRISGVCLRLPPLRQRKEDIPKLTEHFLTKYGQEFRRAIPALGVETERLFHDYAWPGNLRELEAAARVLVALGDERLAMGGLRALFLHRPPAGNGRTTSLKAASKAASQEVEKELILKVLTRTRWNRRRAAAELQISYKALLYKLKQIGFEGYGAT